MGRSGLLVIVEVMFVRNESRWWWACAGPTEDRDRIVTRDSGQSRHPSREWLMTDWYKVVLASVHLYFSNLTHSCLLNNTLATITWYDSLISDTVQQLAFTSHMSHV